MRAGGGIAAARAKLDSHLPRVSARAYAAHLNHFETFPLFAVAVLLTQILEGANATINLLAAVYVAVRLIYTFFYLNNPQPFRSISFVVGLVVAAAIFVRPAFH